MARKRSRGHPRDSPTITSLSETKISVLGGTLLTIYGMNFGSEKVSNKVTLFNPNGVSEDFNFVIKGSQHDNAAPR